MKNYEKNALIMHEICTKEALIEYLEDPNDSTHIVNIVLHRIAETLYNNPTLSFGHYEQDDIHQLCWQWCLTNLRRARDRDEGKLDEKGKPIKGGYNYKTSLFGYLHRVCLNKIFKLKRDKQWRSDISAQKACKSCKHRDTCNRKISYTDLESTPKCKVMAKALKRNSDKYVLSIQADNDITERECHRNHHEQIELEDITEFFGEQIPEKYKEIFHKILHGNITGIPKRTIIAARRWCWKILQKLDKDQTVYYQKIYYGSYQKDIMKKIRKAGSKPLKKRKEIKMRSKENRISDEQIRMAYKDGMSITQVCKVLGLDPSGGNYRRVRRILEL